MSTSRRVLIAVFTLLLAFSASAAKRRAVRSPSAPVVNPGGCHTFGFVEAGTEATYVTHTPDADVHFTITWISDTATETHTTQKVSTPQGNADVETFLYGHTVGNLRSLDAIDLTTTITVPILGKVVTEVEIDFVPGLVSGPAAGWCVGNTWDVPPVQETITVRSISGTTVNTVTTVASQGVVLAVGLPITVPAGTFNTVQYKGVLVGSANNDVQPAITWVSMEHNIVVRQDTLDAAGNVTTTTLLTNL
ncbi:MAG TPA: hypothetical protein VEK57_01435 [Thermoanaerobaculia bacterium]|nr:hypothetical protein [Thermoanaerobaculia bacterium]